MPPKKQKLELTWIGKENRPKLEPRILLEDPELSCHAEHKVTEDDLFDNKLIFGDNLLALKALEKEYTGKVKCVYIDPPFNTGQAFEHYDDGIEHSLWLSLMRDRLEILNNLLSEEGSIWITIDDNEVHYLKVMCDEIFGRANFMGSSIWRSTDNSSHDAKRFSTDHNTILVYGKSSEWVTKRVKPRTDQVSHYTNVDDDPKGPYFDGNPLGSPSYRKNLCYDIKTPKGNVISSPANGWRWSEETLKEKMGSGEIRFNEKETGIKRRTYLADHKGLSPSTLWTNLETTGHNRQAKFEQKKLFPKWKKSEWFGTPKPEKLLNYIFDIATDPGDLVLDSFLGSGTTAAVAHKMGRRWIGIELGDHCHTHCIPRLEKVINGEDEGGITKAVNWKGGGGFRYYRLAPSLLEKDEWDNWVISKEYDANMLAEAVCKLEGFSYEPSEIQYWQHGHSTEQDFIYTTTANLKHAQLQQLSEEVGSERTLLIVCSSFRGSKEGYPNLTIKKIPNSVLNKCEWGKDDYSLNVENLPSAPAPEGQQDLELD